MLNFIRNTVYGLGMLTMAAIPIGLLSLLVLYYPIFAAVTIILFLAAMVGYSVKEG